jgi:UDP-glucuronate 4-epimerase
MKFCLTGAAGFIGFHLARRLLKQGHEVLGIDNLNDYYDVDLKKLRLDLLTQEGLQFIKADIADNTTFEKVSEFKPDYFIHLAAQAGVRYAAINPRAYLDSNLRGFFEVLEWVRQNPEVPLIYASSSSVYGDTSKAPFEEDEKACEPESFYAATKRANELMAISYHKTFGIQARGLRFFTVYGPYGRPDMAYFSFTKDYLQQKPLQVFHEGQALRDFTYIDDIIEGLVAAIFDKSPCTVYNLGHHQPCSTLELIGCIEEYFGKKAQLKYLSGPLGDVQKTHACIEKASRYLGFRPKTSLKVGMNRFLDWYCEAYPCECKDLINSDL